MGTGLRTRERARAGQKISCTCDRQFEMGRRSRGSVLVLGVELVPLHAQFGGRPFVRILGFIPAFGACFLQAPPATFGRGPSPTEALLHVRARFMPRGL